MHIISPSANPAPHHCKRIYLHDFFFHITRGDVFNPKSLYYHLPFLSQLGQTSVILVNRFPVQRGAPGSISELTTVVLSSRDRDTDAGNKQLL